MPITLFDIVIAHNATHGLICCVDTIKELTPQQKYCLVMWPDGYAYLKNHPGYDAKAIKNLRGHLKSSSQEGVS